MKIDTNDKELRRRFVSALVIIWAIVATLVAWEQSNQVEYWTDRWSEQYDDTLDCQADLGRYIVTEAKLRPLATSPNAEASHIQCAPSCIVRVDIDYDNRTIEDIRCVA